MTSCLAQRRAGLPEYAYGRCGEERGQLNIVGCNFLNSPESRQHQPHVIDLRSLLSGEQGVVEDEWLVGSKPLGTLPGQAILRQHSFTLTCQFLTTSMSTKYVSLVGANMLISFKHQYNHNHPHTRVSDPASPLGATIGGQASRGF